MNINLGDRLYHAIFGWCEVEGVGAHDKCLVNLEADKIEYYVMGKGYVTSERDKSGQHILFTETSELFKSAEEVPQKFNLMKMALNPTITFNK